MASSEAKVFPARGFEPRRSLEEHMQVATFRETNWKRLMTEIEHRRVVPVIGPELLDVVINGQGVPLYNYVADELARRLDVEVPDEHPKICEVAYGYMCRPGSDPSEPYYEVWEILQGLQHVEPPAALSQLARIEPLDLFVSTTFDDFMTKALNNARFRGEARAISLSFKKRGSVDDIPAIPTGGRIDPPIVYHVFSQANTLPMYVITEEDLLEFGHQWQDKDRRPLRLIKTLQEKYLLILGCSFQNWLSRFFLCALKTESLFFGKQQQGVVADERTRRDKDLSQFLSRCQTRLYPEGGAREFVAELAAHWQEHIAKSPAIHEQPHVREDSDGIFLEGSFFISYASEDRSAATRIKAHLESAGIDVWLDAQELEPGDRFKKKILRYIEKSSFFLPIISRHVLTPERRFFRLEWAHAVEEAQFRPPELPFIIPLVIDDTTEKAPFIPQEFSEVQWHRLPEGNLSEDFINLCRRRIRKLRRQEETGR
jgi:hypothetical protein